MKLKSSLTIALAFFLIFISSGLAFGQDSQDSADTQWVWGEIGTLDTQARTAVVKYLDYETDQEKEISLNADDTTVYENIKALDELKPGDAVSVDYIPGPDGKNIIKNLSVEKAEISQDAQEGNIVEQKTGVLEE